MSDPIEFLDLMERAEHQRRARRNFIRLCGGAAAMTGGLALLSGCNDDDEGEPAPTVSATPTPTVSDVDVLNFALQLEYLEGNYTLTRCRAKASRQACRPARARRARW